VDSLTGNVKMSRRRALRDLLTRAQVAHGERLAGLYAICSDDRVSSPGDEMDVASEHAEAETHARLIEHRWSSQAVLDDALEQGEDRADRPGAIEQKRNAAGSQPAIQ